MTQILTVAAHEIVAATFPRPPPTERDEIGRAIGLALDTVLGRYSNQAARGRRPGMTATIEEGRVEFARLCEEADVEPGPTERSELDRQITGVVRAFRGSPLFGLERPRSRLLLISGEVGVYAQPDYWDRSTTVYEMKSYRAMGPPPDVALQLSLFQLAFPGLAMVLAAFDRHAEPVGLSLSEVPLLDANARRATLAAALDVGRRLGEPKVLEWIDAPIVRAELTG